MSVVDISVENDFEKLWAGFCAGDSRARERLLALHYDEFRRVARRVLAGDSEKLQIQPTDLAHEAAIRLLRLDRVSVRDKAHFMALSSRIMRQVLIDEVRRFRASKRQMPSVETYWLEAAEGQRAPVMDLEAFDEALERLGRFDADKAKIVEQRFYAGLTIEEIADISGVSESTVKRQWRAARAWLLSQLVET
jgi:RNA polymerase sigma factor (TIGR02999 family)